MHAMGVQPDGSLRSDPGQGGHSYQHRRPCWLHRFTFPQHPHAPITRAQGGRARLLPLHQGLHPGPRPAHVHGEQRGAKGGDPRGPVEWGRTDNTIGGWRLTTGKKRGSVAKETHPQRKGGKGEGIGEARQASNNEGKGGRTGGKPPA